MCVHTVGHHPPPVLRFPRALFLFRRHHLFVWSPLASGPSFQPSSFPAGCDFLNSRIIIIAVIAKRQFSSSKAIPGPPLGFLPPPLSLSIFPFRSSTGPTTVVPPFPGFSTISPALLPTAPLALLGFLFSPFFVPACTLSLSPSPWVSLGLLAD